MTLFGTGMTWSCTRVDRFVALQQVVEEVVAELLAERLDVHEAVPDRGVDDSAHLAVAPVRGSR
jgi:hypothetical protein